MDKTYEKIKLQTGWEKYFMCSKDKNKEPIFCIGYSRLPGCTGRSFGVEISIVEAKRLVDYLVDFIKTVGKDE